MSNETLKSDVDIIGGRMMGCATALIAAMLVAAFVVAGLAAV